MMEDDELDLEADEEVDNILFEITQKKLGPKQTATNKLPSVSTSSHQVNDAQLEAQLAQLLNS